MPNQLISPLLQTDSEKLTVFIDVYLNLDEKLFFLVTILISWETTT